MLRQVRTFEDAAVAMPIPLNLLAGRARAAWLWLKRGGIGMPTRLGEAYEAGRQDERREWARWAGVDHG